MTINFTKYANIMKEDFNFIKKDGESLYIYKKDNKINFKNIYFFFFKFFVILYIFL